ncbi:uncharacterized protein LOC136037647 [Artemia franciscana]|uniref:Uncharacterized protein n=1 Tax=Artemia franciscana TaxID=6661 RepID=A0AA88IAQ5_ARTSF|nr:hypothetical protein QYM36_005633 [Artemia franciscana]
MENFGSKNRKKIINQRNKLKEEMTGHLNMQGMPSPRAKEIEMTQLRKNSSSTTDKKDPNPEVPLKGQKISEVPLHRDSEIEQLSSATHKKGKKPGKRQKRAQILSPYLKSETMSQPRYEEIAKVQFTKKNKNVIMARNSKKEMRKNNQKILKVVPGDKKMRQPISGTNIDYKIKEKTQKETMSPYHNKITKTIKNKEVKKLGLTKEKAGAINKKELKEEMAPGCQNVSDISPCQDEEIESPYLINKNNDTTKEKEQTKEMSFSGQKTSKIPIPKNKEVEIVKSVKRKKSKKQKNHSKKQSPPGHQKVTKLLPIIDEKVGLTLVAEEVKGKKPNTEMSSYYQKASTSIDKDREKIKFKPLKQRNGQKNTQQEKLLPPHQKISKSLLSRDKRMGKINFKPFFKKTEQKKNQKEVMSPCPQKVSKMSSHKYKKIERIILKPLTKIVYAHTDKDNIRLRPLFMKIKHTNCERAEFPQSYEEVPPSRNMIGENIIIKPLVKRINPKKDKKQEILPYCRKISLPKNKGIEDIEFKPLIRKTKQKKNLIKSSYKKKLSKMPQSKDKQMLETKLKPMNSRNKNKSQKQEMSIYHQRNSLSSDGIGKIEFKPDFKRIQQKTNQKEEILKFNEKILSPKDKEKQKKKEKTTQESEILQSAENQQQGSPVKETQPTKRQTPGRSVTSEEREQEGKMKLIIQDENHHLFKIEPSLSCAAPSLKNFRFNQSAIFRCLDFHCA